MPVPVEATTVCIVGAGPAGLTAAALLHRLGIDYVLLERRTGPQQAPAAHAINARSFEIWRHAGIDVDLLRSTAKGPDERGWVHWVERLGDAPIGSLSYEQQGDEMLALTPTPLRNIPQHRVEAALVDHLRGTDACGPRYGHQWDASSESDDGVVSTITGPDGTYEVRSRWLLGADGAASRVRKASGIEPVGPAMLQRFLMVHFAADLAPLVGEQAGVLYWPCDPSLGGGTFVAHDEGEWVFMHPIADDAEPIVDPVAELLVRSSMAHEGEGIDIEIIGQSTWAMTCQVAERYRAGHTFLVGDSAHRFPPTGGMGLNTGVGDVHNLVWKLAAVARGEANESLLDTYEAERKPVAEYNAEQSLANAMKLASIPESLGWTHDIEASRAEMTRRLADPDARRQIEATIADQAEHFDMWGLQMGYRYTTGVVVDDGGASPVVGNPVRDYVPSGAPGGRLPHAWLPDGRSTLDLIDLAQPTLLLGATATIADLDAWPGPVLRMGSDVEAPDRWWTDTIGLSPSGALVVRPDQHIAARLAPPPRGGEELADLWSTALS